MRTYLDADVTDSAGVTSIAVIEESLIVVFVYIAVLTIEVISRLNIMFS